MYNNKVSSGIERKVDVFIGKGHGRVDVNNSLNIEF